MNRPEGNQLALDADPRSAGRARRWVAAQLDGRSADLVDTAELLASELVTNALLHAGPPVTVSVGVTEDGVTVSVTDGSPEPPRLRGFARDSETGRGLHLLDAMAVDWAVETADSGKTVWFRLTDDLAVTRPPSARPVSPTPPRREGGPATTGEPPVPVGPMATGLLPIRLRGVPLAVYLEAEQHNEALTREFQLLAAGAPGGSVPRRLVELSAEVGHLFTPVAASLRRQVDEAQAAGRPTLDLDLSVPPEAVPALGRLIGLLDESDRYCAAGSLLTLQASEATRRFRRWYLREVVDQADGRPAGAWPF